MTGKDDNKTPPFDDDEDWIDRDDDDATAAPVDRDNDELFGNTPKQREPAFPEERSYPDVPEWDDASSEPDEILEWDAPEAENEDLNQLAARELDALGDSPYSREPDDSLPLLNAGLSRSGVSPYPDPPGADAASAEASAAMPPEGGMAAAEGQEAWNDDSSLDSADDFWSDESDDISAAADAAAPFSAGKVGEQGPPPDEPGQDGESRRWPIAMLAIAAVAVILLAVGGYGVISERSALEAEIRQLQGQLATAVSPEEARASRDAREAAERESSALESEVARLRAENADLQQTVERMESELVTQREEAEQALAAARESAEAAAQRSAASTPAASGGSWFVNFGSYARLEDATRWRDRLRVDSGRVVVQDASSQGNTIHRVRVIGLPDKAAADRVARKLESEHKLPTLWVGRD